MKTTRLVFVSIALLVSQAIAQSPVAITFDTSSAQADNISSKEIVLLTVIVSVTQQPDYPSTHDFYFTPGGISPGQMREVAHANGMTITNVQLSFVQFADGSTWGDTSQLTDTTSSTYMTIRRRAPLLAMYKGALDAYQGQNEQALIDYLTAEYHAPETVPYGGVRAFAKRFLSIQQTSGTAAVIQQIQQRVTTAQARSF